MRIRRWGDRRSSCDHWGQAEPAELLDGRGILDRHRAPVGLLPGESLDDGFSRAAERLMRYDVFPRHLISVDLCSGERVAEAMTIVQSVRVVGVLGIEAQVRVTDVWQRKTTDGTEAGFRYVALRGHPERGASSFLVRRERGGIYFEIEAHSAPGHLLVRLGRPLARLLQKRAHAAAIAHFTRAAHPATAA